MSSQEVENQPRSQTQKPEVHQHQELSKPKICVCTHQVLRIKLLLKHGSKWDFFFLHKYKIQIQFHKKVKTIAEHL